MKLTWEQGVWLGQECRRTGYTKEALGSADGAVGKDESRREEEFVTILLIEKDGETAESPIPLFGIVPQIGP